MINKTDLVLLLTDLQDKGINVDKEITEVMTSKMIPLSALKIINANRPMDLLEFYNKLRKSYNEKRSKLYINIMKSDENASMDAKTILTTLSALLNQIMQYQYNATDKPLFIKHSRARDITKVLDLYCTTFDLNPAYQLLKLIKADIVVLEYSIDRRNQKV